MTPPCAGCTWAWAPSRSGSSPGGTLGPPGRRTSPSPCSPSSRPTCAPPTRRTPAPSAGSTTTTEPAGRRVVVARRPPYPDHTEERAVSYELIPFLAFPQADPALVPGDHVKVGFRVDERLGHGCSGEWMWLE